MARPLLFAVLARVPLAAGGVVVTLHVVTAPGRGYAADAPEGSDSLIHGVA